MSSIQEQLKEHLKNGKDWEKMETPVTGVYIVKVPKSKTNPARLNIEINPLRDDGRPFKQSGLFIGSKEILIGFSEAMSDDKAFQLMQILEYINDRKDIPLDEIIGTVEDKQDFQGSESQESKDSLEIEEKKLSVEIIEINDDKELEEGDENINLEEDDDLEEELDTSTESLEETNRLYVDIANLLYSDKDNQGNLKVENIGPIYDTLKLHDYNPILIADASISHKVNNKEDYETLIRNKIVRVAPAGRTADIFILKMAKKNNCKFLTNDLFRDHHDDFDKDWIYENRITYMFEDGELIID